MAEPKLEILKYGIQFTGKHSTPCGYGAAFYGKSRYGEMDNLAGIYQRIHTKKGIKIRKLKHYITTHEPSIAEQASRNKFRDALESWALLTTEEKTAYNKLTYPANMNGIARYIKLYMLDRL
jgi:hypothetical protein